MLQTDHTAVQLSLQGLLTLRGNKHREEGKQEIRQRLTLMYFINNGVHMNTSNFSIQ